MALAVLLPQIQGSSDPKKGVYLSYMHVLCSQVSLGIVTIQELQRHWTPLALKSHHQAFTPACHANVSRCFTSPPINA